MNLTCFYCQTPFTLSMDQKIAALRKMHAENLHHYDAHCPRCGRANAISRERLEMFTPGWEEAIKEPVAVVTMVAESEQRPGETQRPNTEVPALVPAEREEPMMPAAQKRRAPARKRHAPAAKKAARKGAAKKATAKKATTKKKSTAKAKKTTSKSKSKSSSRKTARKSR